MKQIVTAIFIFCLLNIHAQSHIVRDSNMQVSINGKAGFALYLNKCISSSRLIEQCPLSKIIVCFTIDTNGVVINPYIKIPNERACNNIEEYKTELANQILLMPPWEPIINYGRKTKVEFQIPVYLD